MPEAIRPDWPAPPTIRALTTTRAGGVSLVPYDSMNTGFHTGDAPEAVAENRRRLIEGFGLGKEPAWLHQTHSVCCVDIGMTINRNADAAVASPGSQPLAIMTADCLPVIFCAMRGDRIGAAHAGWRGLAGGVLENTVRAMKTPPDQVLAWIGPGICGNCYETGDEVRQAFIARYPDTGSCFRASGKPGHWLADLPGIAVLVLESLGIAGVFKSDFCTFESKNLLYSWRRAQQTGRMTTLIWFHDPTRENIL